MNYLMESKHEARRLLSQESNDPVTPRLLTTGLAPGMHALDAGCGPGGVTEVIASLVGDSGRALGIDGNVGRVDEANRRTRGLGNLSFRQADLHATGLPSDAFDYVFSQYVLQYFADPLPILRELLRVTRPGGKLVISDIDGFGLSFWPMAPSLERGIQTFAKGLAACGFDLHVGKKMFHHFQSLGLCDVRVHLTPFYVVGGTADAGLLSDWKTRFATLERAIAPSFGGVAAYLAFCEEYLGLLQDPGALKYAVTLVTEGVKT
jgi:SAM-dependent methyltransferase